MGETRRPHERRIVAAFDEEAKADEAARAAQQVAGGEAADVAVGERRDEVASLQGEMREEMDNTIAGAGNVGPFTKEMTKGLTFGVALATPLGAVLALPLAFLPILGDLHVLVRIAIVVAVGAFAGATLGFVLGGGMAQQAEEHGKKLGAERGPVVGVDVDDADAQAVARAMKEAGAVRVDEVGPGGEPRRRVD